VTEMKWSRAQRWKNDAIFVAASTAVGLATTLPRTWLPGLGSAVGSAAYMLLGRARKATHENLELVHPAISARTRKAMARDVFRRLGQNLTDTVALLDPTEAPNRTLGITPGARAALESALAEGRGVVYATCHLGPWERMAALLAELGYPITTVARESYDPRFHGLLYEKLRTSRNVDVIYRGDARAPFAIVRALRRGRVVGFLVDLPGRVTTRPVRWLGRSSRVALGPARLALRTGSPIVVGTPAPAENGLIVRIERLPTGDLAPGEAGEATLCQRIADALSERILDLPAHWPWMHPSFGGPTAGPLPFATGDFPGSSPAGDSEAS
jgi:Kdo2-lipid IVA lauroyltransferase/acyltransferase